jgi:hypothetical protein
MAISLVLDPAPQGGDVEAFGRGDALIRSMDRSCDDVAPACESALVRRLALKSGYPEL